MCVSFGQTWHDLVDLALLLWILEAYGIADGAVTENINTQTCARLHVHCPGAKTRPLEVVISCIYSVALWYLRCSCRSAEKGYVFILP